MRRTRLSSAGLMSVIAVMMPHKIQMAGDQSPIARFFGDSIA
jgi:hypothetical protein